MKRGRILYSFWCFYTKFLSKGGEVLEIGIGLGCVSFKTRNFVDIPEILTIYIFCINIYAFLIMYYDKVKAKSGGWRISENKLMVLAIFGGALGMLLSMKLFRHKTLHLKFSRGIPVIFVLNFIIFAIAYAKFLFTQS